RPRSRSPPAPPAGRRPEPGRHARCSRSFHPILCCHHFPFEFMTGLYRKGPDDPTPPLLQAQRYGTVGTWPASSWASRPALSPASCAGSSFGTNLPELALSDVAAAAVLEVAALAASGPASAAPMTPPPKSEPAIAAPTNILRIRFIVDHLLESLMTRGCGRVPFERITDRESIKTDLLGWCASLAESTSPQHLT